MQFKIHGKSEKWYGDGLAFWYLTDMLKPGLWLCLWLEFLTLPFVGPIFGAADYFNGLAVFIDTYANQNNVYNHAYPYISVMINNRTIHHDYETDGFHSVIKGCEAKVRDSKHDTHLLIRYDNDELMVKINIGGEWQECLNLRGVLLPTRGHIGVSASTGDLTDNHDIISLKVYELEVKPGQRIEDRDSITPTFLYHSVILQETDTKKLSNFSLFLITFFTIISIIFLAALFYLYWQMKLERDAKRFYWESIVYFCKSCKIKTSTRACMRYLICPVGLLTQFAPLTKSGSIQCQWWRHFSFSTHKTSSFSANVSHNCVSYFSKQNVPTLLAILGRKICLQTSWCCTLHHSWLCFETLVAGSSTFTRYLPLWSSIKK